MESFEVFLKNDRVKFYSQLGWFIIIINFITILFTTYRQNKMPEMKWILTIFIFVLAGTFIYWVFTKKKFLGDAKHFPSFLFIVISWSLLGFVWISIVNAVLFIFNLIAGKIPIVYFERDHITYPSFPKRKILWSEVSNIIIKDGLLTIDYKNNKLIQQLIDESNTQIDETEFNNFCKEQLNKAELYKLN